MCGGNCGGTPSQSNTVSTPPSWAETGIANQVNSAGTLANQYWAGQYGTYPQQGTAPMTSDQLAAIQAMQMAPGVATPYLNQAMTDYGGALNLISGGAGIMSEAGPFYGAGANLIAGASPTFQQAQQYAAQGTTPLASEIPGLMSPYISNVVNTTENAFNNMNAQAANTFLGNAIKAGNAFGGDRAPVGEAALAGQLAIPESQQIAQLYNAGYGQAVSAAEAQNSMALQAAGITNQTALGQIGQGAAYGNIGAGLSNLGAAYAALGPVTAGIGAETAQTGISDAQLNLGAATAAFPASTVEQQTAQAALTNLYNQQMQQFGLPAGVESWLAPILQGYYGESGGQSQTTAQQGNLWSDAVGILTAGAGAAAKTAMAPKDGGRINFQEGGVPMGGVAGAPMGSPHYSAFLSPGIFVPPNIHSHGMGIPTSHLPQQASKQASQNAGAGLIGLGNLAKKISLPGTNVGIGGSPDDVSVNSAVGAADAADDAEEWRGGVVGYDDGGDVGDGGDYADYMAAIAGPLGQEAAANAAETSLRQQFSLPSKNGGAMGFATEGAVPDDSDTNPAASTGVAPDLPPPIEVAPAPKVASADDPRNLIPYIRQKAEEKGVHPDIASHVARSEGLTGFVGDKGTSFGAFQLHKHGGLGDEFQRDTGLDPADPKNERATIDYALDHASKHGWEAFHGAKRVGIGNWEGIKSDAPQAINQALAFSPEAGVAPPARVPKSGGQTDTGGLLGFLDSLRPTMSKEAKMALMSAGFGMMGPSRDFFRNLGAGAQRGLETYMTGEKLSQEAAAIQAKINRENVLTNLAQTREERERMTPRHIGSDRYGAPVFGILNKSGTGYDPITIDKNGMPVVQQPGAAPAAAGKLYAYAENSPEAIAELNQIKQKEELKDLPKFEENVKSELFDNPLQGKQVNENALSDLAPGERMLVKLMVQGKIAPPTSFALAKPFWREMIEHAALYDPDGFDMAKWGARNAALKDMTSGVTARNVVRRMNTAANHMGRLDKDQAALDNWKSYSFGPLTKTANAMRGSWLANAQDPRVRAVNVDADAVSRELETAFKGNQPAVSGLKEWRANLGPELASDESRKANNTIVNLAKGHLDSVADQWRRAFGTEPETNMFLSPEARKVFDRIGADEYVRGENKPAAPAAPATAAPTAAGQELKQPSDAVLKAAKEAIKNGKDAGAVKKRLQENGYDSSGLE